MKNRSKKRNGILMLCALSCTLIISCKKDVSFESDEFPATDEVVSDTDTSSASLRLESVYTRRNLMFDYTTEPTNALAYFLSPLTSWHNYTAYRSTEVSRSRTVARTGAYSIRYELNKSDGMVGGGKRAETYRNPRGETKAKIERWYGASYYLPSDYVYDAVPEVVTQWHTVQYTGSPMLALWTAGGQWKVVQMGKTTTALGAYERNKWTDFVFHVKWSSGGDGLVEVWKNGSRVMYKTGPTLRSGLTIGPYFRTGLYKWGWNNGSRAASSTSKRVIYVDEVRVGNEYAKYADVKPGS